ncbi:hypothetical protein Mycsm_06572 (plasmid) [Mycobacterium sp. JS623]|uniref:hypothetical protein n=1 Tax=Mycobacterium sp. JS623 TaxID=212767 RepID=UPI0002A56663|nr:hypothetical protein [Mycobacterium sp. JS623]AGB26709.1 hypothetical protein Mycsm_06572 [Mycobacterium sp. JS623]
MDHDPKSLPQQLIQPNSGSTGPIFWAPVLFAAVLSGAYLVLLGFLYTNADQIAEPHWSRVVYVAGGLGGLVTTAIGWVFGREVHRGTAEVATAAAHSARGAAAASQDEAAGAHSEALRAHTKASQNDQEAASGRALAAAIKAGPAARGLANDAEQLASVTQAHLATLESMANELFPDADADGSSVTE